MSSLQVAMDGSEPPDEQSLALPRLLVLPGVSHNMPCSPPSRANDMGSLSELGVMTPRAPLTPCDENHQLGDRVWFKQLLETELFGLHHKLDQLAVQVSQVSSENLILEQPVQACSNSAFQNQRRKQEKLRRIRSKVKAIGAMAAAGKRALPMTPRSKGSAKPDYRVPEMRRQSIISKRTEESTSSFGQLMKFWDSEADARMKLIQEALHADQQKQGCKRKIWQLFESPYSSKYAFMYAGISNGIVIASILASFLEAFCEGAAWDIMQVAIEVLFAIELSLRFFCCPHRVAFLTSFFSLLDLLSIIPLGLRLSICTGIGSISDHKDILIVSVPIVRLLKLLRRFEKLHLLLHAFELACEALPSLLYMLLLLAFAFAEVIYLVEPRDHIPDLPTAMWFSIVSMTTVGYGDITPTTPAGHAVASAFMVISGMYMAIPLGIVGNAFSQVWDDRDRLLVIKRFRCAFLQGGFSAQAFEDVFSIFDEDGTGSLDLDEFSQMLKTMQMSMSEERVSTLYQAFDKDGIGHITREELMDGLCLRAAFMPAQLMEATRSVIDRFSTKSQTNLAV